MVAGEKAYASRFSHGRLIASTAMSRGYGTGDTNRGNFLLNLVANRSIKDWCHLLHIDWKTSGRRDHVWPSLEGLFATTFSWPGMCRALSHLFPGTPGQDSPQKGNTPTSCLLLCSCMTPLWCCRLLQKQSCLNSGLRTLSGPRRSLSVLCI